MCTVKLTISTPEELETHAQELVRALQADYGTPRQDPPFRVAEAPAPYGADRPSDAAFRIFCIAAKNWFREKTEIRGEFGGTSGTAFNDYVESLKRFDYVTLHTAKTFKTGGQIEFMLPTPLGKDKLKEAHAGWMEICGDAPPGIDGTHIYYQNRIAQKLAANGWAVKIEQALREKRVDVGAIRNGIMHAYEVVNEHVEKEIHNLIADLDDGWHHVWFCVGNEQIRRELKELVRANFPLLLDQCDFALLGGFR